MADFVAVLKKTIDGLGDSTPETRQKVYDKARATIAAKLAAISPPPAPAIVERQKQVLEDAIAKVESDYRASSTDDPLAELENVFASLKNPVRQEPRTSERAAPKPSNWDKPPQPVAAAPVYPAAPPPFEPVSANDRQLAGDETPFVDARRDGMPARRRSYAGLMAVGIVLAVVAGAGYGVWLNRDAFGSLMGGGTTEVAATQPGQPPAAAQPAPEPRAAAQQPATAPAATAPAGAATAPAAAEPDGAPKFTQRLLADGSESDEGGSGGLAGIGEGTSVAAVTQLPGGAPAAETPPATQPSAPPSAATPQAPAVAAAPAQEQRQPVAVGQRAIFYEERTTAAEGSAELGNVVWSIIQESPGANRPPEPAIRAEAAIPGKDVQLRMTIRRNADQSLPASHIIEMIFLTPQGFGGGGIDNILRVALKGSEQEAGSPLAGNSAKIADGFFLVALNEGKPEQDANLALMQRQSWIDIPVIYKTGRRALITMEKGIPGDKVFQDAIRAWQAATASAG